jgi:5-methylcytosine-specific restriction endonuclease McrA
MIDKKYKDYLNSNEWAQIRIDLFNIRGKKCEDCGNTKRLQIHHLTYKNIFNEEPEDLKILCKNCHQKEYGYVKNKKGKYKKKISLARKVKLKKKKKRKKRYW